MNNDDVIKKLTEDLKNAQTGDDIREVILTAIFYNLDNDQIEEILGSVHFSDEKWEEINMSDKGVSK